MVAVEQSAARSILASDSRASGASGPSKRDEGEPVAGAGLRNFKSASGSRLRQEEDSGLLFVDCGCTFSSMAGQEEDRAKALALEADRAAAFILLGHEEDRTAALSMLGQEEDMATVALACGQDEDIAASLAPGQEDDPGACMAAAGPFMGQEEEDGTLIWASACP